MKNTNKFKVYKHTSPNGKIYIGITSKIVEKRWGNGGIHYKSNKHFWNAIQKYGWDNFKHEILFKDLDENVAYEKEIELIKKYNSNDPNFGYNNSTGGEQAHLGCKHSKESRKKMSKNHADFKGAKSKQSKKVICLETNKIYNSIGEVSRETGINNKFISRVVNHLAKSCHGLHFLFLDEYDKNKEYDLSVGHTEESYKKMSEKLKGKTSWIKGKKHSLQSIEKMRKAKIGKKATQETKNKMSESQKHIGCKKVICLETNIVFKSVSECSRQMNISNGCISSVCRGVRKSAKGFHFLFLENYNKNKEYDLSIGRKHSKTVICLETKEIFKSASECSRKMGILSSSITSVCRKERKSTHGFHFEYYDNQFKK